MHDPGFDHYLETLSRLLRLSRRERDDIRRELAAHIEEFIETEMLRGATREQALRQALDEFGDAAELAARFHYTDIRKRWIMRGTAAAACVGLAVLGYSYIGLFGSQTSTAGTGNPAVGTTIATLPLQIAGEPRPRADMAQRAKAADAGVEAALQRVLPDVSLANVPLSEVLSYLQAQTDCNMVVLWRALEERGISRDETVELKLKNVTVERVLSFVLDEFGDDADVDYTIRDGVLLIGPQERLDRRMELVVYDVADLLSMGNPAALASRLPNSAGRPAVAGRVGSGSNLREAILEMKANSAAQGKASAARAGAPPAKADAERAAKEADRERKSEQAAIAKEAASEATSPTPESSRAARSRTMTAELEAEAATANGIATADNDDPEVDTDLLSNDLEWDQDRLMELVCATVRPNVWEDKGGTASIHFYGTAMVVRASSNVHRDVRDLLKQLAAVGAAHAGNVPSTPAGLK